MPFFRFTSARQANAADLPLDQRLRADIGIDSPVTARSESELMAMRHLSVYTGRAQYAMTGKHF